MNVTTETQRVLAAASELEAKLVAERSRVMKEELSPLIAQFCTSRNIPGLLLKGYTPGFNDGDVCEHSQTVPSGAPDNIAKGTDLTEDQIDEVLEYDGNESVDWYDRKMAAQIILETGDWRSDIHKEIEQFFSCFEEVLHNAYGTDWSLMWVLNEDGTVSLHRTDYDCGY